MTTVTIHKAKTNLSKLIEEVRAGGEVVIAKGDTPVARLVPYEPVSKAPRTPGRLKGRIHLDESFFEPLADDELRGWDDPA